MKKFIITVTVLSFMNLAGCYYQKQMNPSDFNFNDKEDIQVTTKDTTYNLSEKDYYYENDTLFTTRRIKYDAQSSTITNLEIPVEEIKTVEVERTDAVATILTVFGVLVGALGVLFLMVLASSGWLN